MKAHKNFKLSGECHDRQVTVELDHWDTDIEEAFEAFVTVMVGLGWSETTVRDYLAELGAAKIEEDHFDKPRQSTDDAYNEVVKSEQEEDAVAGVTYTESEEERLARLARYGEDEDLSARKDTFPAENNVH